MTDQAAAHDRVVNDAYAAVRDMVVRYVTWIERAAEEGVSPDELVEPLGEAMVDLSQSLARAHGIAGGLAEESVGDVMAPLYAALHRIEALREQRSE